MGLDVILSSDKTNEILNDPAYEDCESSLSRTFCWLLMRIHGIEEGVPELDQIGKLTGLDISLFYTMMDDPEEELEFRLPHAKTEEERQAILRDAQRKRLKLDNNISDVKELVEALQKKLKAIPDLPDRLERPASEKGRMGKYFSNFEDNPGDGYIGNNLGQDLRNFSNYLELASRNGAANVWFSFG
ncbi:MAG: hypothetical protein MRZ79_12995 [Bacteroidia bacterium]|nr:hypothetical protein [Bacteroidia bacterium]